MAGYLEEKKGGEGHILTWQTPNRQRLWGIVSAIPPALLIAHGLYGAKTVNMTEVIAGSVVLFSAFLVATWTVKFGLDLKAGTYQHVKGFLPFLFGQRGPAKEAFQCVAIRAESFVDAAKHEDDINSNEFDQYRVFMVWKNPRKEAMLIDTIPGSYAESLDGKNHHQAAVDCAQSIAKPLKLEVLDQAISVAVVSMAEKPAEASVPENASR